MSLRLIYGRAGSGKTHFCLEDIKKELLIEKKSSLILLVPEQFSMQSERDLLRAVGERGLQRAEVISFKRMAYRVFNEVGGVTKKYINSSGKSMLLHSVANNLKAELRVFKQAINRNGFIKILSDTIAELKRYNISPQNLQITYQKMDENEQLKHKLRDIYIIYSSLEKEMSSRYIDSEDELTIFAEKLNRSTQFDGATIWIDEFSGFTPQEYKIIEKLMIKCKRVNIALCSDCESSKGYLKNSDVFSPVKKAASRIITIAQKNNIEIDNSIVLDDSIVYRFIDNEEMLHLEKNFFSFPHTQYMNTTKNISIYSAANIYSEVENTAKDIIKLVRDEDLRYRDIAVAVRKLSGYDKLIKVIFKQYDIPCFIDSKRDVTSHPLILLILSALDIIIKNWSYDAIFSYLKTGLTDIPYEDIDIIENYVLSTGIKGSHWLMKEKWDYRISSYFNDKEISDYEEKTIQRINEVRDKVVAPLLVFDKDIKSNKSVKGLCTVLYKFLCSLGIPERIEEYTKALKEQGELDVAGEYAQIWNMIIETIDQLVEVLGSQKISVRKFKEILTVGFSEHSIGLIPPAVDQVIVGNMDRSIRKNVKAMYILGVNDKVFPAVDIDEGIISDNDREVLGDLGVELAQNTKERSFEEQFLIYTVITASVKYLWFSFAIADHEGKSMRQSTIISRLKKVFPNMLERSNITERGYGDGNIDDVCLPGPTFNTLIAAMRESRKTGKVNPLWSDVYNWYKNDKDWSTKASQTLSGLEYTNLPKGVDAQRMRNLIGAPLYSSISRIEKYTSCPFSYFIQYGLRIKERKVRKMDAPDIGTLIHDILNEFSIYLKDNEIEWKNLDVETCEQIVDEIIEEMEKKKLNNIPNLSHREKFLLTRLKRIALRSIHTISEHISRGGFEPVEFEAEFGDGGKYPPIIVKLPSGEEMRLVGRIDRIDKYETNDGTYLRIIDYKSGNKEFKLSDLYYGLQIQLAAYMDAVCGSDTDTEKNKVIPGGIMYFKVDDPIISFKNKEGTLSDKEIEKEILKKMKMKGLLLNDIDVIKGMDNSIDGYSLIIPARLNKSGEVSSSSSVVTYEGLMLLRKYLRSLLSKCGEYIFNGDISIDPYKKKKNTACDYCKYAGICQFDMAIKDNKYRVLKDLQDKEVWELIEAKDRRKPGDSSSAVGMDDPVCPC